MKKFIKVFSVIIILFFIVLAGLYFGISPSIKLNGESKIILNVNDEYNEEGATLKILNSDKSDSIKISGEVNTSKVGTYTIYYKSNIKYLNSKPTVKRIIEVKDGVIPTITFKGDENITLLEGEVYNESGYDAEDNYDGNITSNVVVEGKVDTSKPGSYELTYKVTDSSGNTTTKKRKVIVKEKPKPIVLPTQSNSNQVSNKVNNAPKKSNTPKNSTTTLTNKNSSGTGSGIAILMYHYFYDKNNLTDEKLNSNYMEIHSFEEQMKYLHDSGYYFPTWQEVADFIDGKISLPAKSIVVTIDDGHKSFFNLAVPILEKYNIHATSFIITSKDSVKKVPKFRSENINFQSHTHNMHRGGCSGGHGGLFRCISHDQGVADLKKSIEILGSNDVIAYPYGDVTDNTLSITREAGFKVGVTTVNQKAKKGMNRLQLPRVRMSRGISLAGFKAAI